MSESTDMRAKPREFDHTAYPSPTTFDQDGRTVLLCRRRQVFVPAGPEEVIRQKFISYLVDDLGVPEALIDVEYPLSRVEHGNRGRADIVVVDIEDGEPVPLMVIECKADNVPITDDTIRQVLRYDAALNVIALRLIVTNGIETRWFAALREADQAEETDGPLTWSHIMGEDDLLDLDDATTADDGPNDEEPLAQGAPTDEEIEAWLDEGYLGAKSPREHHAYIVPLIRLLHLEQSPMGWRTSSGETFIDTGIRNVRFGNASGGSWFGNHRYFVLESDTKSHSIVGIGVFSARGEESYLSVSVDGDDRPHNSLQLNLDRFVRRTSPGFELWHDGRLAHGHRGSVPRAEVLAYVSRTRPDLIVGERVVLGNWVGGWNPTWEDMKLVMVNLVEYGLLRHKFRRDRERA